MSRAQPFLQELSEFAGSVALKHRDAMKALPVEIFVSYALNGSVEHIFPFLQSYMNLACAVEASMSNAETAFTWDHTLRVS